MKTQADVDLMIAYVLLETPIDSIPFRDDLIAAIVARTKARLAAQTQSAA